MKSDSDFGRCSLCILCVSLLFLAGALPGQDWGKPTDQEWSQEPPAAFPEAKAIVLFDHGHLTIKLGDMIRFDRHVRIKVFDKEGIDDALIVEVPYYKDDRIKFIEAHTITPEGKKKDIDDWYKKRVDNHYMKTGTFPAVEEGCILEYKYRIDHERYRFLEPWHFQGELYRMQSRFSVALGAGFTYSVSRKNVPMELRTPEREDGREVTTFTWEMNNIMPAGEEPLAGATEDMIASLHFQLVGFKNQYYDISFLSSWPELGQAWDEMFEEFFDDSTYLATVADSICGESEDSEDKVRCLYEYVRDGIETRRYIDEDDDVKAKDILEQGHADLHDKNSLLTALLRAAGIEAHLFLIGTRDEHGPFNAASKQLNQFNRILCFVGSDSGGVALDAGSARSAYPYLPPNDLVEAGLLIDGEDTRPVRLYHPERKSGIDLSSSLHVSTDGSARCTTNVFVRGYEVCRFWDFVSDSLSQDDIVDRLLEDAVTEYTAENATAEYDPDRDRLSFQLVLDLPSVATVMDGNLFLSPCVVPILENPFSSETRHFPIDFQYRRLCRHRIRLFLPENYEVADIPNDIDATIDGAWFTRKIVYSPEAVDISADCGVEKTVFSSFEYPDLKSLFELMTVSATDQFALAPISENPPASEEQPAVIEENSEKSD